MLVISQLLFPMTGSLTGINCLLIHVIFDLPKVFLFLSGACSFSFAFTLQCTLILPFTHFRKFFHILNVSSGDVITIISKCKKNGGNLTAETCPHYLCLAAEHIEDCHTEFKTHPPIRPKSNQEMLWAGIKSKNLEVISSDHSPATPGAKCLIYGKMRGNFLKAWAGISSLQFGKFNNLKKRFFLKIEIGDRSVHFLDSLQQIRSWT